MYSVVIIDDNKIAVEAIAKSTDWEKCGCRVAGTAYDGIAGLELIHDAAPDIVIIDIQMPGFNGLDVIKKIKGARKDTQFIIISGYSQFEYAQQAISYGVGYYLLKPVNKGELTETLQKLQKRIRERKESRQSHQELVNRSRRDDDHLRANLLHRLLDQPEQAVSEEALTGIYHLQVSPGVFQAFCVKADYGRENRGTHTDVLMEKVEEVLERNLKAQGRELVLLTREDYCYGILNYPEKEKEQIRRSLKSSLTQLDIQKNMFQRVSFSIAAGAAYKEACRLGESMQETRKLIQERLVRGNGRLLEHLGQPSDLPESQLLNDYLRKISHAVEIFSIPNGTEAVRELQEAVNHQPGVQGWQILELIYGAADIFAASIQIQSRTEVLDDFRKQCGQCGKAEEIFGCLVDFQEKYLKEQAERYENDTIRPVRKAKEYIQNHYSDPITLEEVSEQVGLSSAYFSVLFKKTEGEGFAKYLINIRMEQAKLLLRETNLPVTEICRKVGYNDLKHFTHTFEKAAGVKPSTYRKLYG